MTTRKVQNPNQGNKAFIWAIAAVIAIAALVIGIVVFNGRSQRAETTRENMADMSGVTATWSEGDDIIHLAGSNASAPTGVLFDDYSCTHCADFHQETEADMIEALKAGKINVDLRPMMFQDRGQEGHSTKSLAAFLALIAHDELDAAFSLRDYLFANQQQVWNKLENDDFAQLAKDYGASEDAVNEIRDGKFIATATKMGDDNLEFQKNETGEAWTPRVWVDGKDLEGEDRANWVEVLANS